MFHLCAGYGVSSFVREVAIKGCPIKLACTITSSGLINVLTLDEYVYISCATLRDQIEAVCLKRYFIEWLLKTI